ncbi:MAG: hypothetical protein WBG86_10855 [Polyangiales bacterium]
MNALRTLRRNTDGSVMTMSLFMALFIVGAIYYTLGVGDAILYRRMMQDAADAGAQAASIVAAKGMNLHVLLNVVMAVTAGILLVIRSVEVMLEITLGILAGLAATIVLAVKAGALIATLTPIEHSVERLGDGIEEFVKVAHDALDVAHEAVQHGFPLLAEARAIDSMAFRDEYRPTVAAGFVVPLLGPPLPSGAFGLPVRKGSLGITCDRIADGLGRKLDNVSSKVPKWLTRFLGGLISKSLRLGKNRTCDDDVVEAPRIILGERSDGSELWLGHEEFQYRAYDIGANTHSGAWGRGERGVRLAQGGRRDGSDIVRRLHSLGRVGFAQSEYYFSGTEPREEWLWKQRWRARLRRFRASKNRVPQGLLRACTASRGIGRVDDLARLCDVVRDFSLNAVSAH